MVWRLLVWDESQGFLERAPIRLGVEARQILQRVLGIDLGRFLFSLTV